VKVTYVNPDPGRYRAELRKWLDDNLTPVVSQRSRNERGGAAESPQYIAAQRELQQRIYDAGYAGITIPAEYGGQSLTQEYERIFSEESAGYLLPDFGVASRVSFGIILPTIVASCSAEFKRRHIPRILAGQELWCQFFSEPDAGSDLAGVRTRAQLLPDGQWSISGAKIWSSGALIADYAMCLTRTNWDAPKHKGLTWFAVPTQVENVTIRTIREISGGWEFCEAFLDDVKVSADHIMGEVDSGWSITHTMLVYERGAMRGNRVSLPADIAPDLAAIARRRDLIADPHVRSVVATAYVYDVALAALTQMIEDEIGSGAGDSATAAYVKLARGTLAPLRAMAGLEIAGSYGIAWPQGDEEARSAGIDYLNGRILSIAGGSNEMQRNAISERVLGLPRERTSDREVSFRETLASAQAWNRE
jgi:alkylation response protein AidB-like acyl-CoA dehydrogenase